MEAFVEVTLEEEAVREAGAVVVAVCSRYGRGMIAHCGAHAVVDTLEQIRVVVEGDGLKLVVTQ